jgi:3-dehydroquinate synthase
VTHDRLRELIDRSVQVKLTLVEKDELDLDVRRHLNYGHTLGQALEVATGYRGLNHGEAVGLGMLFAAAVAELSGVSAALVDETRRQLEQVGLPTLVPPGIDFDMAWALMAQDKKVGTAGKEFVLCERPGAAVLTSMPCEDIAREAFTVLSAPVAKDKTA